jgi:alcohol dehydrogenase (cytochrome c)
LNKKMALPGAVLAAVLALTACNMGNKNSDSKAVNFPTYGYDLANTRHVPFKEVTADNVNDLGVVWTADFKTLDKDVKNGNQSYPVIVDGVIYITTGGNQVFAFEGATGKQLWHWKPTAEMLASFSKSGIVANRGVSIGEGKVFMLTTDNQIVSLDQKTGELLKMVKISDSIEGVTLDNGYYETTVPIYYKGNIYIGSSGGDNGVRGFVAAYKASDLTPAWDSPFWTVPPKGQDWLANSKYHGGGAVWNPVAIDEETGIMYFAVGNPAPDFYGEDRPGANPYTDSVVAVESATGKLIWSQQEISHDLWDYDAAASPMILNATVNGKAQKVVVEGGKSGQWWAWDAATGEVVWDGIPFAKIDHPNPTPEGVLVYPGVLGGENYAPETYDPGTNYVLIPGIEYPALIKSAKNQDEAFDKSFNGAWAFGTAMGEVPADVVPYGTVTAIDVNTGKQVYQNKTKDMMRGGLTSTASGLAFYGELDGNINAMDIKSGKVLWTFQTAGDNIQAAPALFMADGKQYLTFTSGGTKPKIHVFAIGGDKTQGSTGSADNSNAHTAK